MTTETTQTHAYTWGKRMVIIVLPDDEAEAKRLGYSKAVREETAEEYGIVKNGHAMFMRRKTWEEYHDKLGFVPIAFESD